MRLPFAGANLPHDKARALCDAGWRQEAGDGGWLPTRSLRESPLYDPTLEELIAGCPAEINGGWFSLDKKRDGYVACYRDYAGCMMGYIRDAKTAKEAVCDLWLSLPPEIRIIP
jgi:hypothetical protein